MEFREKAPLLDAFYESAGLPCCVFNTRQEILYAVGGWRGNTRPQYYQYIITDFTMQKRDEAHPLVLMFDPGLYVGVARLDPETYLVTAPVGPFEKKREEVLAFCTPAIQPESLVRFCDFMISLPRYTLRKFNAAFSVLIYLCCGRSIAPLELSLANNSLQSVPDPSAGDALFSAREELEWHVDQSFEEGVCAAVEAGDIDLLNTRMLTPYHGRIGQMSLNALNQARYTFVSFAVLLTRAAIHGGLPQETAYSLSDVYCQQMDRMFDTGALTTLSYKMALEFCRRVGELRAASRYSPPVQKCVDYIDRHLHEAIRVSDLAELCGLCTRSISSKFRQETGAALSEYIAQEKIKEAQYLLANSDYSLLEISMLLQYNSQSYFTQKFKEACGMTPQKYRELNKK